MAIEDDLNAAIALLAADVDTRLAGSAALVAAKDAEVSTLTTAVQSAIAKINEMHAKLA